MQRHFRNRGMGLIEIVIGSAIIVTGILSLISAFGMYISYALAHQRNVQAAYLAEEGLEAVTYLRDKSWTTNVQPLSTTTTYYLAWDTSAAYWKATTTMQYIDAEFLRTFAITDVVRDSNGRIATTGTYDADTKKITVNLSYREGKATTTKSMTTYIADIYSN
ncbi:MAG: hypothetical protein V4519_00545 [Patescibacteria group bacterium]